MTDESLGQERETHIISLYSGTLHFLLLGVPVLGIALIGSAYWWDVQSGDSCNRLGSMLDFLASAVRWYAGVLLLIIGIYIQSYTGPGFRPWHKCRTVRPALARSDS